MFRNTMIFLCLGFSQILLAHTIFLPENGHYVYSLKDVASRTGDFVRLKKDSLSRYKFDRARNEYQVKDWFLQDWYKLQDMFELDSYAFIRSEGVKTFNEAKRKQYARFLFDKKKFFHYKTIGSMKEWGGLTHPPVKKLTMPLDHYDSQYEAMDYESVSGGYFDPAFQKELDSVSRSELSFGNKVIPLADDKAFQKKLNLIRRAKESILLSSLVFVCDPSTRQLVDLLIQKHRENVDVKILVDGFIGKVLGHRECLKIMRKAGLSVVETGDFFRHKLKAIYHTKTLVVDLKEAVAGGHNLIDADNTSKGTDFKNRDVDLHINGPMVTDIAKQFVENWDYQRKIGATSINMNHYLTAIKHLLKVEKNQGLRGNEYYNSILKDKDRRMFGVCRFIKQAPYEDRHSIGKAYLKLLDKTQNYLAISDPVKTDTIVTSRFKLPLADKLDNFEMYNRLHEKVQELGRKGKKIDYITTNINMAGNENVAIMNERIRGQLESGKEVWASWSLAKLHASNVYFGRPHYKNLLNDWVPFKNVHVWTHMSFIHSKIFYFDRVVASVGSYNFQHNATDHAYESTAICMDENLNRKLDVIMVEDMANSIPLIYSAIR